MLVGRVFKAYLDRIRGANRWKSLGERPTSCRRYGQFICDTHWAVIESSQSGNDPIHSACVHLACAIWLSLNGYEAESGPVTHACCKMPADCFVGILERSRTNFWVSK